MNEVSRPEVRVWGRGDQWVRALRLTAGGGAMEGLRSKVGEVDHREHTQTHEVAAVASESGDVRIAGAFARHHRWGRRGRWGDGWRCRWSGR